VTWAETPGRCASTFPPSAESSVEMSAARFDQIFLLSVLGELAFMAVSFIIRPV
jgi:hypothetical protein